MQISTDGLYSIKSKISGGNGGTTIACFSGDFGGATLVLGYYDSFGNFIVFVDGSVTGTDTQYQINHGASIQPIVQVTGSGGSTAIAVAIAARV